MIKHCAASKLLPNALGGMELLVLEALWLQPHLDAKAACEKLPRNKTPSLRTVQSTLERLYKKNRVDRIKQGHSDNFFSRISRSKLFVRLMGDVTHLLHDGRLETI